MKRTSPFASGIGPALNYFAFRFLAWLAEHLSRRPANLIAAFMGRVWFRVAIKKRSIVSRNLARVVGEGPHLERVVRAAFDSYALYWLETFRVSAYSKQELTTMVSSQTVGVLKDALGEGRGAVLATAHFGFYDLGVAWVGAQGIPMAAVAEVLRPRALFEWFADKRSRGGIAVIPAKPREDARQRQQEFLDRGGALALLSDRDLGRRGVWVTLFGERTTIPAGPSLMVAKTGVPLLYGAIYKKGEGFTVDFERIEYALTGDERRDTAAIAQLITDATERTVRKSPEQWHLFSTNWPADEEHLPRRGAEEPSETDA